MSVIDSDLDDTEDSGESIDDVHNNTWIHLHLKLQAMQRLDKNHAPLILVLFLKH